MAENITWILTIVYAVILFILYHKIFHVIYFSLSDGLFNELIVCFFGGLLLAGGTMKLLGGLIGGITGIVAGVLHIVLRILSFAILLIALAMVVWAVRFLLFLKKEHINPFKSEPISNLSEKPEEEASSFLKMAYLVYHNRVKGVIAGLAGILFVLFAVRAFF